MFCFGPTCSESVGPTDTTHLHGSNSTDHRRYFAKFLRLNKHALTAVEPEIADLQFRGNQKHSLSTPFHLSMFI